MASREAAKSSFFKNIFSPCIEMVEKMLGNKGIIGKCGEKKSLPGTYSHPAGGQETHLFLRVA